MSSGDAMSFLAAALANLRCPLQPNGGTPKASDGHQLDTAIRVGGKGERFDPVDAETAHRQTFVMIGTWKRSSSACSETEGFSETVSGGAHASSVGGAGRSCSAPHPARNRLQHVIEGTNRGGEMYVTVTP